MSDMTIIDEEDLIETIADALQYISYYHPIDYIEALGEAFHASKAPPKMLSRKYSRTVECVQKAIDPFVKIREL